MSLSPLPIRLFCDLAARNNVIDLNTSQGAMFYRGDDIEIDIGIGQNEALLTSLGNLASVTWQLYQSEADTNPPMMSGTVAAPNMNLGLTQAQWTANTGCHAAFLFSNNQTAASLNGQATVNYWIRLLAQTTDTPAKIITLLDGPVTVKDGPISTVSAPPGAWFRLQTVGGNIVPQVFDPVSGHYYNLEIDTVGGARALSLGDSAY
ncbi:MAG: hypothetical protein ABSA83_07160 [Verrucomicrobiota bacterium]|jgi:hypothetical protein